MMKIYDMARKGRQKKRNSDGLHGWRFGILIGLMDTRLRRYTPLIRQNISFYINHHGAVEFGEGDSLPQDTSIGSRNRKQGSVCGIKNPMFVLFCAKLALHL